MKRTIKKLLVTYKAIDEWAAAYVKGLQVEVGGDDYRITSMYNYGDEGNVYADLESVRDYPDYWKNEADMIANVGELHKHGVITDDNGREILKIDSKYLNHRGRREKSRVAVGKRYGEETLEKSIDPVDHSDTQCMSFEDAITVLLIDGKNIRRRGWFGKLLFRNPGDFVDGGWNHPGVMSLKLTFDWQGTAETEINDSASLLSKDDRFAHDWEVVDYKLPWGE